MELWHYRTGDGVYSSPAVADGVVFVGSDDGALYALSDRDSAGGRVPARAVYFDEKAAGVWFTGGQAIRDELADSAYSVLDANALARYLEARIAEKLPSVVVFACDVPPSNVLDSQSGGPCLLRTYLESGGRVVWIGVAPCLVKFDTTTGKHASVSADDRRRILGFAEENRSSDGDEAFSRATREGLEWGLPEWESACFPVHAANVSTVLARDPSGAATAWVKTIGAGSFVRFWGRERPLTDAGVVRRLAEHRLAPPAAPSAQGANPPDNFDVQRLADGVYAVVRREPPGLMIDANNVFIIGDDGVVVVDANGSRTHTQEVLAALRTLTDKPVRYVVNTHWHDDHIMGNQVYRDAFPGVEFVGHERMREYLPATGAKNHAQMLEQAPKFADMLRSTITKNKSLRGEDLSPEERASYASDVSLIDQYVADAPGTDVVLPTITVDDHVTLHLGSREVQVRSMGSGHTAGDLVVYLPKENIVATGDLVVWPVPLIGADQSYVGQWAETLGRIRALKPAIIVPGHGHVLRDDSYLELMARFLASAQRQTDEAVARGETLEQAQKSVDLEEFRQPFAGDSKVRSFLFDVYAVQPAIGAAFREARSPKPNTPSPGQ